MNHRKKSVHRQKTRTLAIIGAGMAGSKLASVLAEDKRFHYRIVLIGAEKRAGYNRIMLSSLLAQDIDVTQMSLVDMTALRRAGVDTITGDPVVDVITETKSLSLQSGRQIAYDKLIFATGSTATRLPIEGTDATNVMCFRNWQDVERLSALPENSSVCVIGAGLLGLEAAVGLTKRGHKVTVVHRASSILNRQLDAAAAEMLQAKLVEIGIEFRLGVRPEKLLWVQAEKHAQVELAEPLVNRVQLSSGDEIATTLVVMATGITPEVSLAKQAGLEVNRAIVVNGYMETSQADIYALGECCEFQATTFGLIAPIWQQLDCLVAKLKDDTQTMLDSKKACQTYLKNPQTRNHALTKIQPTFQLEPIPTRLKVSGIQLFSVGDISRLTEHDNDENSTTAQLYQNITLLDKGQRHYRRLILEEDKLVGIILYGDVSDGNWFFSLLQSEKLLTESLDTLIFGEVYNQDLLEKITSANRQNENIKTKAATPEKKASHS
ncbi:NAD(P)/FAD-dependent oxidoreductase [Marinomonas agarivorans]|nr:NAD(P)/FAD-dependent oxidoreductase [Marinomonas agarivorans]